ncbi:MAG: AAA family ATPase [Bryobacteraceae bacterium]|jgi:pilus assembly protein CpaE
MPNVPDSDESAALAVALVMPNATRRRSLVAALAGSQFVPLVHEFGSYPSRDDLPGIARLGCQVLIVDLDDDVEQAIHVIENIGRHNAAMTVMAASSRNDSALMRRSMQAGARDFLVEPFLPETVGEAFARTYSRGTDQKKALGRALVFVPSKGGVGVTTIALNFALALMKECGAKVVVVDMDFQLGEIAPGLGMTTTFSVVDALASAARLDREFLATLLMQHGSGLAVLGSPESYDFFHLADDKSVKKLFRILREEFDYVVVDSGSCRGDTQETLFGIADTLYLVTEMTFASLRNAHRLISFLSARDGCRHMKVVANRFNARYGNIDGDSATKALTRPVDWKIPNAYAAVRTAQDSGVPIAMNDSPYTRAVAQMAKAACGKPLTAAKKAGQGFNLFGLRGLRELADT